MLTEICRALASGPASYEEICSRLDLGILGRLRVRFALSKLEGIGTIELTYSFVEDGRHIDAPVYRYELRGGH